MTKEGKRFVAPPTLQEMPAIHFPAAKPPDCCRPVRSRAAL
jgi:hypothetical protein